MITVHALARNWGLLALRGTLSIIFGLLLLALPTVALGALVLVFGAYALADGLIALATGIRAVARHERSWPLLLEGMLNILAGILVFGWPGLSIVVLIYLIGIWAIMSGIALLAVTAGLHRMHGEWLLVVSGLASVLLGIGLLASPLFGAIILTIWLGAYALVFGISLVVVALRLRHHHQQWQRSVASPV